MEIWTLHFFLYYKKQIKYSFLHQFCSDSHETGTIGSRIPYPLKGHCDYISTTSLTYCQIEKMQYFALKVAFPRDLRNKNICWEYMFWYMTCNHMTSTWLISTSPVHCLITWWVLLGLIWFWYQHFQISL